MISITLRRVGVRLGPPKWRYLCPAHAVRPCFNDALATQPDSDPSFRQRCTLLLRSIRDGAFEDGLSRVESVGACLLIAE
jgi:hypothetical protein